MPHSERFNATGHEFKTCQAGQGAYQLGRKTWATTLAQASADAAPRPSVQALASHPLLTLQSLRQWAAETGLSRAEAAERWIIRKKIQKSLQHVTMPYLFVRAGLKPVDCDQDRNLDLRGCTHITKLPARLAVFGWLEQSGCINLTALPEGLTVEKHLHLGG